MVVPVPGVGVGEGVGQGAVSHRLQPVPRSPPRGGRNSGLFSSTAVGGEIGTSPLEDCLAGSGRAGRLHVPYSACAGEKRVHAAAGGPGMPPAPHSL